MEARNSKTRYPGLQALILLTVMNPVQILLPGGPQQHVAIQPPADLVGIEDQIQTPADSVQVTKIHLPAEPDKVERLITRERCPPEHLEENRLKFLIIIFKRGRIVKRYYVVGNAANK